MDIGKNAASTLPLVDAQGKTIGIASLALPSFISYSDVREEKYNEKKTFKSQEKNAEKEEPKNFRYIEEKFKLEGLASVLMSAWLYGEDDLHANNFGLFQKNKNKELSWGRLDFGMSFAEISEDNQRLFRETYNIFSTITLKDLQRFPNLEDSKLFYWPTRINLYNSTLNIKGKIKRNSFSKNDEDIFKSLGNQEQFIKEKNEFLLRQFLIPIETKKSFIRTNISDQKSAERISNNIENRIYSLRYTALADQQFRDYFKTVIREYNECKKQGKGVSHTILYNVIAGIDQNLNSLGESSSDFKEKLTVKSLESTIQYQEILPFIKSIDSLGKKILDSRMAWKDHLAECGEITHVIMSNSKPIKEKNEKIHQAHQDLLNAAIRFQQRDNNEDYLQSALNKIQSLKAEETVLCSIDQIKIKIKKIHTSLGASSTLILDRDIENLKKYLIHWAGKLDVKNDDFLYQQEIASRLRSIEYYLDKHLTVLSDKKTLSKEEKRILQEIIILTHKEIKKLPRKKNISIDSQENSEITFLKKNLTNIQANLIKADFALSVESIKLRLENKKGLSTKFPVFPMINSAYFDQNQNKSGKLTSFFNGFIKNELTNNHNKDTMLSIDGTPLAKTYLNIPQIINNFFDEKFMIDKNSNPIKIFFEEANAHLKKILNAEINEESFFQIELTLAKLAFDYHVELVSSKRLAWCQNMDEKNYSDLLTLSKSLSSLLSQSMHSIKEISELKALSEMAVLSVKTMKNPSQENAFSCLNYVQRLSQRQNSYNKSIVSVASTALALLSLIIFGGGVAATYAASVILAAGITTSNSKIYSRFFYEKPTLLSQRLHEYTEVLTKRLITEKNSIRTETSNLPKDPANPQFPSFNAK